MTRDIILADNQDITRMGLEALIPGAVPGHGQLHHSTNRNRLSELLAESVDAVVILDYTLFDFYGVEQLLNMASRYERSSWVLFSEELGRSFLRSVSIREQFGVVMKNDPAGEISAAIASAYDYRLYRCETALRIINEDSYAGENEKLTASEISILREISLGRSTKEIAAGRCLSFHTVNSHRKNIFRKLGVNNVQEAIRYALRAGIIDMADYTI
ncbi:MAG: response regulator transcription factor [Alistipes sp.]|nr:response regulator transcription factor [Alistipes sp.]